MNKTAFGNLSKTYKNEGKVEGEILDSIKTHLSTTKGNPHKVTLEEIGAYSAKKIENKSVVDFAVAVETFGKPGEEDNKSIPKFKMTESEGLAFEDNDDGETCSVSGIGTCSDKEVVIPMFSPSGKLVSTLKLGAFEGNENITALFIPKSVYKISSYSINCPNLKILALSNPDVQTSARKITAQLDKVYYNGSYDAFIQADLTRRIMSENTKLFCGFFDVDLLLSKADADKVYTKEEVDGKIYVISSEVENRYTKEEIDNMLSLKRDLNDFVPVSSDFGENEDEISLVGITDITYETTDSYPVISDNYVAANGSEEATFFINFKGNATISIISTHLMGTDRFAYGVVKVDGVELRGVEHSQIDDQNYTEYTFNGNIKKGIEIQAGSYTKWQFITFSGSRIIYSDGFMSGEQAERLDNLDTKIGNIDAALDELHNYATSLIGGDA